MIQNDWATGMKYPTAVSNIATCFMKECPHNYSIIFAGSFHHVALIKLIFF